MSTVALKIFRLEKICRSTVRCYGSSISVLKKHYAYDSFVDKKDRKTYSTGTVTDAVAEKEYSPHIHQIVDQIGKLTLIEVADLNALLKQTLKISDAPMTMMPAGGMPFGAVATDQEEEVEAAPVSNLVTVKLTGFDAAKKVALIKEIKATMEGTNLVQAKKLVESLPQTLKTDLTKDDADALKTKLEAAGAQLEID